MNTWWQVRISGGEESYAAQAAQAAFAVTDHMERLMSRFRDDSEISAISKLESGARIRLSREVFDCLSLALEIQTMTAGAFDVCALMGSSLKISPGWSLDALVHDLIVNEAPCRMDLGAIAKGFTLDRMAEELKVWGIDRFLMMSSGSSILAGDPPIGASGWAVRLGDTEGVGGVSLSRMAVGTSGFEMKGAHIVDPTTGRASTRYERSWAFAPSAAEADALSTSWMNMEWGAIGKCCEERHAGACVVDRSLGILKAGLSGLLKTNPA
jgi:thiamine biosynthesis lipoprotein